MAGVVPKRSTSGRKQWTLHGPQQGSLKRLRNHMASDGCPESQVVLAKQLLEEETEFESEKKENARLGVYWLIKASEQGNIEATDLLKSCLQSGKGISEHNYLDVKSCITMTQDEKVARKAAREMFANLSNGGDYITSDQLQKKILSIDKGETCSKSTETTEFENYESANGELMNNCQAELSESDDEDWSQRSDNNSSNEKLTEDHLVSAAVDYSHGHLPIVNRILCLNDPNLNALDHISPLHRSILHPHLALKIIYFKLIKFLGKLTLKLCFPIAKSEVQLLLLMILYSFVSTENLFSFLPMIAYCISFICMFVTTFQMLQCKREFSEFRLWSGLFICYSGGSLNAEQSERQYIKNNLKPYGQFFLSLLVNLLVYPLISNQWIPQSELTIIAFCLTFMTLIGFMPRRRSKTVFDTMVLFSFAINVLAKYPYDTDPVVAQGWRFLDLKIPTFPSYVIGNGIEFCINFKLLLYCVIPLIFVRIASMENWRGAYKTLIPHCVTLSWLQICIISSQGSTMFGFLRGTLALVGVVLFLPLVTLTSIILPVVAVTEWFISSNIIYICVIVILTILSFTVCYFGAQSRFKKYIAYVQVFLLLIVAFSVVINFNYNNTDASEYYNENKRPHIMSWEVFQRFCHQPILQEENIARAQMKCAELEGAHVHWDGYITNIKVKSIRNFWKTVFDKFQSIQFLHQNLYCLFGDEIAADCDSIPDIAKGDCISFYDSIKSVKKCSLSNYNLYTFEILVKMQSGIWVKTTDVNLIANHVFKNYTLSLKPGDHIWFKGVIFNNEDVGSDGILGGLKPNVELREIGCIACHDNKLSEVQINANSHHTITSYMKSIYIGVKFVLNVIFNPIVIFK